MCAKSNLKVNSNSLCTQVDQYYPKLHTPVTRGPNQPERITNENWKCIRTTFEQDSYDIRSGFGVIQNGFVLIRSKKYTVTADVIVAGCVDS